ncbi:MAG: F0F1 ATP synthase subunit B [Patescibacteria group bacterium]
MELIEGLGLDWKLLLAQLVNFAILLAILYKFAYKPLIKMLHDRSDKIDKSLKDAKKIEEDLKEIEVLREETMSKTRREAQTLLDKAKANGEQMKQEMASKAKEDVEKIVGEAHTEINLAKQKMISEAKEELGELVVSSAELILREKIDTDKDKELIDKSLKGIK